MHAIKASLCAILFVLCRLAKSMSPEEADELMNKQMSDIAKGDKLLFNSTKLDDRYVTSIDVMEKDDREDMIGEMIEGHSPRQEYRCMTREDRERYHESMINLKKTVKTGYSLSEYDLLVRAHNADLSPAAHGGPAFLLWHRHYTHQLDTETRKKCKSCSIPYWDSRLERRLGGNPQESVLFSDDLAGNAVGIVRTGFASQWAVPKSNCSEFSEQLIRELDPNVNLFLPDDIVEKVTNMTSHEELSRPWNDYLELMHGRIHAAVGGHMGLLLCSPIDPLFFYHHCFIDYIFQQWLDNMKRLGKAIYYANTEKLPAGFRDVKNRIQVLNSAKHRMLPFNIENDFFLSNDYGITFELSPGDVSCKRDSDCCRNGNTEYVFCDVKHSQCVTKLMQGGRSRPNFPSNQCHCHLGKSPVIKRGICACE